MDMQFYGICVSDCPEESTYICDYSTQQQIDTNVTTKKPKDFFKTARNAMSGYTSGPCWYVPMRMENIFYRCLPMKDNNETTIKRCKNPNGGFYGTVGSGGHVVSPYRNVTDGATKTTNVLDDSQYYYFDQKTRVYLPSGNCDAVEIEKSSVGTTQVVALPSFQ